jgi:FMN-dependent NADH-azoreductase
MKILHIDSSIQRDQSASRQLTAHAVEGLRIQYPNAVVIYHDLAREPIAHLSAEVLGARFDAASVDTLGVDTRNDIDVSERALAEFLAADAIVIGAPMYNFSIPSQLKAWIDRISVAGRTFRYSAAGPEGLAKGKKIVIASSRGGVYSEGAFAFMDHQETYLRGVFNFLGVTDIEFIRAEGYAHDADRRAQAVARAREANPHPLPLAA